MSQDQDNPNLNPPATVEPYRHKTLLKANQLIGIKYRSSVLENQLIYLGMLKVQNGQYESQSDGLYVSIQASEIRNLTGRASKASLYNKLHSIALSMGSIRFGWKNDKEKSFEYTVLINKTSYSNGVFRLRFAKDIENYLLNLQTYTKLPSNIVMRFKKPYSFRLYETLKAQCYYPSGYNLPKNYVFEYELSIAELKLIIGVVDVNEPNVKTYLSTVKGHDEEYEKAVEMSSQQLYTQWSNFEAKCIGPSVDEINDISDIVIEYKVVRQGRGGKAKRINFKLYVKDTPAGDEAFERWLASHPERLQDDEEIIVDDDAVTVTIDTKPEKSRQAGVSFNGQQNVVDELTRFAAFGKAAEMLREFKLPDEDILAIVKAAGYEIEKVQTAYNALKDCETQINDVTAWLISAIKNGYKVRKKVSYKKETQSGTAKNAFTDYEQRTYDYDDLMAKLRKAQQQKEKLLLPHTAFRV